jgi:hypothetical protein
MQGQSSLYVLIFGIVAITMVGGIISAWIRTHAGGLEAHRERQFQRRMRFARGIMTGFRDEPAELDGERQLRLLSDENAKMASQMARLEERVRTLEAIATDPAHRTAREIDALRDR